MSPTKIKRRELSPGFTSELDTIGQGEWYGLLDHFDDANIYQTWAYDEVRCGRKNISHLVLKRHGEVVAIAQARLLTLPLVKAGIAYVRWGPLWRRRGQPNDPENFRQAIRALHNEYAVRRRLVLRIYPMAFNDSASLAPALNQEKFSLHPQDPDRTLLLDLSPPLDTLRKSLRPHWHRYLKVAERNELDIIEGTDDNAFQSFIQIYREMLGRKGFAEPNDINQFRLIQQVLPGCFKMKVMLCYSKGELCNGLICSAMGNTAEYLFGATSHAGLKSRGAYLLQWKMIEWLKLNQFSIYDLNGINPATNPGTYKFKSDLCGNHGKDVYFLGRFDSHAAALSQSFVYLGDTLSSAYRKAKKIKSSLSAGETKLATQPVASLAKTDAVPLRDEPETVSL